MHPMVMLAAAGGDTTSGGIGAIITAITDVISVTNKVFDFIVGNPLLLFFTAAGVLGTAIGVFSHVKHIAK